jgi:hypothetical protein
LVRKQTNRMGCLLLQSIRDQSGKCQQITHVNCEVMNGGESKT